MPPSPSKQPQIRPTAEDLRLTPPRNTIVCGDPGSKKPAAHKRKPIVVEADLHEELEDTLELQARIDMRKAGDEARDKPAVAEVDIRDLQKITRDLQAEFDIHMAEDKARDKRVVAEADLRDLQEGYRELQKGIREIQRAVRKDEVEARAEKMGSVRTFVLVEREKAWSVTPGWMAVFLSMAFVVGGVSGLTALEEERG